MVDHFPSKLLDDAQNKGIPGGRYYVVVEFTVGEDGNTNDFKAITNFGYGLEEGLIELVKSSGSWIPATAGGKNSALK